jgi:hypothetical protein
VAFIAAGACSVLNNTALANSPNYICLQPANWSAFSRTAVYLFDQNRAYITDPAQNNNAQYLCENGAQVVANKRYTPDYSRFGFCEVAQCYTGTSCVNRGEWYYAHACEGQIGWNTRTQLLADTLYKLRENRDFVLHCDKAAESITDPTIPNQYATRSPPIVNTFCTLSEHQGSLLGSGRWETVAVGTTLNTADGSRANDPVQHPFAPAAATGNLPRFIAKLNASDINITNLACSNTVRSTGYTKCDTNKGTVYYNREYGILFFSTRDPGDPNANSWTDSLQAKWQQLLTTPPVLPLTGEKIYVAQRGSRFVQGTFQYTPAGANMTVAYRGVNTAFIQRDVPTATWSTLNGARVANVISSDQRIWEQLTLAIRPR